MLPGTCAAVTLLVALQATPPASAPQIITAVTSGAPEQSTTTVPLPAATSEQTPSPATAPPTVLAAPAVTSGRSDLWPDARPFARLFQNLGRDLVDLPSLETAIIVGTGAAGALIVHPSDDNLSGWAAARAPSAWTPAGSKLGEGWLQGTAALGVYVAGRLGHHAPTTHIAGDLVRAQMLNGVITAGLKVAVDRRRPSGGPHAFPSGHTSASFASAAVVYEHFGWKAGAPAYALAGFVGLTRVRDRAHWVSDTVFGAAIGIAAGHTVTRGHRARSWTVVPAATRHTVGFYVVKAR